MQLTHAQRFDIQITQDRVYAPFTLGCPSMLMVTDYRVFKKSDEEKAKVATFKSKLPKTRNHKFITVLKASF